jgi:hypothetical protein
MRSADSADRAITWLGFVLVVAWLVQAVVAVEWPVLAQLQGRDDYKMLSGTALGLYLFAMWSLVGRRQLDPRAVIRHKLYGALGPLVLFAHATRFAHGYLALLAGAYLALLLLGLHHRMVIRLRVRWLFTCWFVFHVATAMLVTVCAGYHVVIAIGYE